MAEERYFGKGLERPWGYPLGAPGALKLIANPKGLLFRPFRMCALGKLSFLKPGCRVRVVAGPFHDGYQSEPTGQSN